MRSDEDIRNDIAIIAEERSAQIQEQKVAYWVRALPYIFIPAVIGVMIYFPTTWIGISFDGNISSLVFALGVFISTYAVMKALVRHKLWEKVYSKFLYASQCRDPDSFCLRNHQTYALVILCIPISSGSSCYNMADVR